MLKVLLKKQITERLSFLKKDKKQLDFWGLFLTLLLTAGLIAIVVWMLSRLVVQYTAIRSNGVLDIESRQYEMLTLIYGVLMIIGVISGIRAINFSIFENDDRNIIITMPIKSSTIFYSKIILVYLQQVVFTALTLIPTNLTFAIVASKGAYYVLTSIAFCFIFPIVTLAIASVFAFPCYFIKRFFQSKYLTSLIVVTIITGLLFWGYSGILNTLKVLVTTGEMRFFFNAKTMNAIIAITKSLYPANIFAKILLKTNVGMNILWLALITLGTAAVGYVIVNLLYTKATFARIDRATKIREDNRWHVQRSSFKALLSKEFLLIFRTPSYAFQYFSVAAVMPLMVYFCLRVGSDLLQGLVMTENNFELTLALVLLFGALTNTICATNISRDGNSFFAMKTIPLSCKEVIGAKILLCAIVAVVSTLVSVILAAALGYVSWGKAAFVFFIGIVLQISQICFATRKDLNHPHFSTDEDFEVREINSTVSQIIIIGLVVAALFGGLALFVSVYYGMKGVNTFPLIAGAISLLSLLILGFSLCYLFLGLQRKYYQLQEGD